ncbi:MAG: LTA synthase family protein [Pseudomonadota bacterium]
MSVPVIARLRSWSGRERYQPLIAAFLVYLAAATLGRMTLMVINGGDILPDLARWPLALGAGLLVDTVVGLYACLPLALFLSILPARWLDSRAARVLVSVITCLFLFGLLYLLVAEVVFFHEFNSRFNNVAVDYLIHPKEVFVNIRDTYPVKTVLTLTVFTAAALFALLRRYFLRGLSAPLTWRPRAQLALFYLVPLLTGAAALNINSTHISDNRILNEIAGNGVYSFFHALINNESDYDTQYARIPEAEALQRLRRQVAGADDRFTHPADPYDIAHAVQTGRPLRPMNVVIVLEESLGSLSVGSLHPQGASMTPEFDRLSDDGLYFTRIYSTGNRTVRGIEATLTGLPPMPARSVVKRKSGVNLFSLPSVLQRKGYETVFIYGGRSYFDNIRAFSLNNGFNRVIDQDDFKHISFTTIWGVCDEDIFQNSIGEFNRMHAAGKPFFATVLTVSNHTPYTYPAGRIPEDPAAQRREHAIKYADYSIGKFMREARRQPFFRDTLFVFLGDHGARVHGSQEIPIRSYEIPVLFYAPGLIAQGRRVDQLGSQMDVAPTILGLLGIDHESRFVGRDLLRTKPSEARALFSHNRDVGLLRGNRLAVLGVRQSIEVYEGDPRRAEFRRLPPGADPELVADAIAYFQGTNRLYQKQRLQPLAQRPIDTTHAGVATPGHP